MLHLRLSCTHTLIIVELVYWLVPVVVLLLTLRRFFSTLKILVSLCVVDF